MQLRISPADTNNRANVRNKETRVGLAMGLIPGGSMLKKEIESRKGFAGLGLNDVVTPCLVLGYY